MTNLINSNIILNIFNLKEKCLRFDDTFKLKSGKLSPYYVNLRELVNYPETLSQISELIYKKITLTKNDKYYLCGLPYAGIPYANFISHKHKKPQIVLRKEYKKHGLKNLIDGKQSDINNKVKLVLIDDILSSGKSVRESIDILKEYNYEISEVILIVDREEGGYDDLIRRGIKVISLFKITDILDILLTNNLIEEHQKTKCLTYIKKQNDLDTLIRKDDLKLEEKIELNNSPIFKKIINIMLEKKSNLAVALDLTDKEKILSSIDKIGKYVVIIKLHCDIINDFDVEFVGKMLEKSNTYKFLIFEDRKFSEIGNIFHKQYTGGVHKIRNWANIINFHLISGPKMLDLYRNTLNPNKMQGGLLVAEMSTEDCLIDINYTEKNKQFADQYKECIFGFISQRKIHTNNFIYMTPGIGIDKSKDNCNQRYTNPHTAIFENKTDIIIVGRNITDAEDIVEETIRYKSIGWNSYLLRVKKL